MHNTFFIKRRNLDKKDVTIEQQKQKQTEKTTELLARKDYKLRRLGEPIAAKPARPHQRLHLVRLGRRPALHKHHDGKASTKKTGGQASTRGPSLRPQTTSPGWIETSTGSAQMPQRATATHPPGTRWSSIHPRITSGTLFFLSKRAKYI